MDREDRASESNVQPSWSLSKYRSHDDHARDECEQLQETSDVKIAHEQPFRCEHDQGEDRESSQCHLVGSAKGPTFTGDEVHEDGHIKDPEQNDPWASKAGQPRHGITKPVPEADDQEQTADCENLYPSGRS